MTKEKFLDTVKKSIIQIIAGSMVALFAFYLARNAQGNDNINEKLNKKLDKTEFKEYKTEQKKEFNDHLKLHELEREHDKEIKSLLIREFDNLNKRIDKLE